MERVTEREARLLLELASLTYMIKFCIKNGVDASEIELDDADRLLAEAGLYDVVNPAREASVPYNKLENIVMTSLEVVDNAGL